MKKNFRWIFYLLLMLLIFFFSMGISHLIYASPEGSSERSLSAFPILMYDTDIGLGYGAKVKFVDFLARKESLDVIVFNSSRGKDGMFSHFPFLMWRSDRAESNPFLWISKRSMTGS